MHGRMGSTTTSSTFGEKGNAQISKERTARYAVLWNTNCKKGSLCYDSMGGLFIFIGILDLH